MKIRELTAVALVSAIISAGVGFGLSQASQPDDAGAAKSNATVKQLVKIDRSLGETNETLNDISEKLRLSGSIYNNSLAESLEKICAELKQSVVC